MSAHKYLKEKKKHKLMNEEKKIITTVATVSIDQTKRHCSYVHSCFLYIEKTIGKCEFSDQKNMDSWVGSNI